MAGTKSIVDGRALTLGVADERRNRHRQAKTISRECVEEA